MSRIFLLGLFFLCYSTSLVSSDNIEEYDDENFDDKLNSQETALVMFYAPWCGHCKKLKPHFEEAAETLHADENSIALLKIDCTEGGKKTCEKHSIKGYPTLKIFKKGKFISEYSGTRDASGIISHMRMVSGPISKHLSSENEAKMFVDNSSNVVVVGVFNENSQRVAPFEKVAEKMFGRLKFAHYFIGDGQEEITLYRPLYLRNKFEEHTFVYQIDANDEMREEKLIDFIHVNHHGLVGHRTTINVEDFKPPVLIAYFGMDYKKKPTNINYWRNRLLKVSQKFIGSLSFAFSSVNDFTEELKGIDVTKASKQPVILVRSPKQERYVMEANFSVDALENFINDYLNGNIEPRIMSEPIPEDNPGPVKIAVGKTARKLLLENENDVLVKFHAPWCTHCKRFAPIYKEIAEKLEGDVEVFKMDATNNDLPFEFKVSDYPTIYFIKKDFKDKPVKYDGESKRKEFIKFISMQATDELKAFDRKGNVKKDKQEL